MAVWFVTLAVVGLIHLGQYPRVLLALSPNYALAYAGHVDAGITFAVLGSVFLALTGREALYADMGHFGSAIRISWFAFVARSRSGLSRSRRSCARRSGGSGKSLFPPVSELAVGARNSSDDRCDRDRKPSCIVRRLRSRSASHSARGHSASRGASDLRGVGRPGLCASSQLAIGGARSCARLRISFVRRARQRLRNRSGRRHDGYDAASHSRRLRSMALACCLGLSGRRTILSARPHFRVRQRSQDSRGRLVYTARRIYRPHAYAGVAKGPACRFRTARPERH